MYLWLIIGTLVGSGVVIIFATTVLETLSGLRIEGAVGNDAWLKLNRESAFVRTHEDGGVAVSVFVRYRRNPFRPGIMVQESGERVCLSVPDIMKYDVHILGEQRVDPAVLRDSVELDHDFQAFAAQFSSSNVS